jgi:hypothetical protein
MVCLRRKGLQKPFTSGQKLCVGGENGLNAKLLVDGEEVDLNEFVEKILGGTLVGAVTSLRGVKKDWKKIELVVTK